MGQTLEDFINTYEGFDWENGEVVIIDQRVGKSYLCHFENGVIKHPYHISFDVEFNKPVYNWTHSKKTMVITL